VGELNVAGCVPVVALPPIASSGYGRATTDWLWESYNRYTASELNVQSTLRLAMGELNVG